jgi:hypothetical protein
LYVYGPFNCSVTGLKGKTSKQPFFHPILIAAKIFCNSLEFRSFLRFVVVASQSGRCPKANDLRADERFGPEVVGAVAKAQKVGRRHRSRDRDRPDLEPHLETVRILSSPGAGAVDATNPQLRILGNPKRPMSPMVNLLK